MPEPREGETRQDFVERCIPIVLEDGTAQDPDQAAAVCHSMWEEAQKRLDDTVIAYGGEIKSLGDGRIGGYLVRFTTPDDPDLEGEYFDAETDFGIEPGAKTATWFNHRIPVFTQDGKSVTIKKQIGEGTLTPDERGIFIEAVLYEREMYEELLDKMGWSSGTAAHLVDREPVGKAYHITRWLLGLDASITPAPAEPRNGVVPLKALADDADQKAKAQAELSESSAAKATESDEQPASIEPEPRTTITEVKMTEELTQVEQPTLAPTLDASKLAEQIANGLNAGIADAVVKAMQAFMDKAAPEAKGGFSVDEALDKLEGTKSFGDWLLCVRRGDTKRLKDVYGSVKVMQEQTGAEGGYLVPAEFLNELVRVADPFQEVVYPRARKIPGSRRSIQIPVLDQTGTPAAADKIEYYGGVVSYWTEEAAAKTATEPDFKQLELVAHKLAAYTQASDELLADSAQSLDALLRSLFAGAIRFRRDYAYLRGTGAGQPLGVLNSGALLTTARDVANQVSANDIHSMMAIFLPTSMGNATWVINQTCMEWILALGDGTNWIFANDATQRPSLYLYGIPIVWTEKTPALGTTGDVMLCDFSYYYIYDRSGIAIDVSQHYAFINDLTTWRCVFRTDGQPCLSAPIYIDTTNQVSPFVALLNTTD
ncbi:MAG: phage major capsid protein [Anaerolineae bacterium]|nr:phage major capsid protein [Anaerolineae bacterium]